MKKFISPILALTLALAVVGVNAQSLSQGQSTANDSASNAVNSGLTQNVISNSAPIPTETTVRTAPGMFSPGLVSGGFACLGSKSGAVSVIGFGGSGGSTLEDEQCNGREWFKLYVAAGLRDVGLARICQVPSEKAALEITGYICPQAKSAIIPVEALGGYQGNDPIVIRRLTGQ